MVISHSSKLKLAVCLFGHLRTFKQCAPFLRKNLLNKCDYDLFMHTWTTLDHNTKSWHDTTPMKGETNRQEVIDTYGELKGLEIEEQEPQDWGVVTSKPNCVRKETQMSIFGIDAMYHSIREANRLQEAYATQNNIKYDLVLFIRPDIWLKKPVDLKKILEVISQQDIEQGFFTCANEMSKLVRGFESLGGNDCLFFATPHVISDVVKNTTQIASRLQQSNKIEYCPEYELIKLVIERSWTPYKVCLRIGYDWDICRPINYGLRRKLIRIRVRKSYIRIHLFELCMRPIFQWRLSLLSFEFDFCIGAAAKDITEK